MNINRLMSRRDKDGSSHRREKSRDKSTDKSTDRKSRPISSDGLLSIFKPDPQKKLEKEHAKEYASKVQAVKQRLKQEGITDVKEEHINFALGSHNADGSVEKAVQMLHIFQQSLEGLIKPYSPDVYMRGAINRNAVTCYIDSLLFAMFGRLDSFEPIILRGFEQEPKRRLAAILRVYVNMLRQGILIHTDITEQLQKALAECGWEEAISPDQQDVSEAFNQLASILELPLLSLKVDLFHFGRDDDPDDHKVIEERLLDVAVPDEPPEGRSHVRLEDCLENYFNNRVLVLRRLERTNTNSSLKPSSSHYEEKGEASALPHINVNVNELNWSTPDSPITPGTPLTPNGGRDGGRDRATSIIRHVVIQEEGDPDAAAEAGTTVVEVDGNASIISGSEALRKGSVRKEIMMPAWQFFNLIPWSTDSQTKSDAAVAAHLKSKPVLGICLKRYGFNKGQPFRKNTLIDIPLDIRLPHFINDHGEVDEDGPLIGQFKLSLQSVVCHRGNSTNSGHYISFIRGTTPIVDGDSRSKRKLSDTNRPPHYSEERWIKSDDLACPRVINVDIEEALKNEMPYLLFYQVQPYENVSPPPGPEPDIEPPSYTDTSFKVSLTESTPVDNQPGYFDGARDEPAPSVRVSNELERPQTPRQSINLPDDRAEFRRGSLAFTENSMTSTSSSLLGTSTPVTPIEETTAQRMSRAASRFTKLPNRSRPTSQSGENRVENRISATFSRLNLMKSKEGLNNPENVKHSMSTGDVTSEPRKSITSDEYQNEFKAHLAEGPPVIERSKSKKEKKRDKSKGPSEKLDGTHHHGHSHKEKGTGKGKVKDGVPDRECNIM
ncbi:hypothetical protein ONS96_006190 [Cadophora gregata f. sp. sojae]|nr:hypothetical protein ONS96_006190 [Cadophora gregata f. sp. sojae]